MSIPLFLIPFLWFLLGLILMAAEVFIPGFVIFFFGFGAVMSGILTAAFPILKSRVVWQVLIWLGSSTLSLFLLRRYLSKVFRGRLFEKKAEETDHTGEKAEVIEEIRPDRPGRVRFRGTSWKAESYDEVFKPGERVEILKTENLSLVVTRSILGELDEGSGE